MNIYRKRAASNVTKMDSLSLEIVLQPFTVLVDFACAQRAVMQFAFVALCEEKTPEHYFYLIDNYSLIIIQ